MTDAGVFSKRGLDYGTRVLIESVVLPAAADVVDLGCGYGAVAAVLGLVYPHSRWTLLDVNERAVALAAHNVQHLGPRARVLVSDGFAAVPDVRADAILLNPPARAGKAVVYRLLAEAAAHLQERGKLWVVVHKQQGADSVRRELGKLFQQVERAERVRGYSVWCCSFGDAVDNRAQM
ncbi:MAG: methyltransferase [Alicyclobacillus sp.]|nr:methyltransferase [Alicyclobacillus sp.]